MPVILEEAILKIENLLITYEQQEVLCIDNLNVLKGECVAVLGNNGAGKTTLLKSIVDLIDVKKGRITIEGINVKNSEEWKKITSIYLDSGLLIPYLNAEEYLRFVGKIKNVSKTNLNTLLTKFKDFYSEFNNKKLIRNLSTGNKNKIGLLSSFLRKGDFVLLDEPYANLDITSKKQLSVIIKQKIKDNSTFLISSHNLEDVLEVASRVVILKEGKIVLNKLSKDITSSEIVNVFLNFE